MLRIDPFVPEEIYHIYNRGIDKRIIFKSSHDYHRFMLLLYVSNSNTTLKLDTLINILHKRYEDVLKIKRGKPLVSIGAWCLMPNHFHLLLREETPGGITKLMRKVGTGYSMYFNKKYKRTGGLFGGPFKSKHVGEDNYLKHLFGYIHLNPLDINFSGWENNIGQNIRTKKLFLGSYEYSSYQEYMNFDRLEKGIIDIEKFPAYFSEGTSFDDFINYYLSTNE